MRFSLQWLLALSGIGGSTSGLTERVAETLTSRGLTVDAIEATDDDPVLDVDIPANRPDCLGHLGLARELVAALGSSLAAPPAAATLGEAAPWVRVAIDDPTACPRYTAGLVEGVSVAPSPPWVARRLAQCGLRSVNNVVDASNLVLLELGHPIHFFDRDKLEAAGAATIVVRPARSGERLTTLDGVERVLDPGDLVIADASHPLALAGIIGGAETAIDASTRSVLIEAARFDPRSVRATARRFDLRTDASFRFERGVDPATAPAAQALAARLLAELAGGRPAPAIVDLWPGRGRAATLELRASEVVRLLGHRPADERVVAALDALGLSPLPIGTDRWRVTVPSWRVDLEQEADLVEEVARHLGYGEIPSVRPASAPSLPSSPSVGDRLRDVLSHLGFHEAFGYSMIPAGEDDRFVREDATAALVLTNPIAETMARLRRSLLPGLLRALEGNLRRGNRDVRLFETGRAFLGSGGGPPREPSHAALVWCGSAEPRHWSRAGRAIDLFDLTGVADHVLRSLGGRAERPSRPVGRTAFHPGLAFCWTADDGRDLAWGGALHPDLAERYGAPAFACEIDLDAVTGRPAPGPRYEPVSRFPAVTRDLAVVLAPERRYAELLALLREVPAPCPVAIEAVDRYEGPPLEPGASSVTVRFTLEPREATLTDAEVETYRGALVDAVSRRPGLAIRS
jgi:phenylalanyl-tRNA synthetase beta chain